MPGTCSPSTNFSCDTRMWMAAAVVKPETSVSDRYMTTKPTCMTPIASWRRQRGHVDEEAGKKNNSNSPSCTTSGSGGGSDTVCVAFIKTKTKGSTSEERRSLSFCCKASNCAAQFPRNYNYILLNSNSRYVLKET